MNATQALHRFRLLAPMTALGLFACASNPSKSIGHGAYQYQYTLYETRPASEQDKPKKTARNTPYRLFLIDRDIDDGQKVYHSRTDDEGKTVIVHSETEIKPEDIVLVKRIGDGAFGTMFALTIQGTNQALAGHPYKMHLKCPNQPTRIFEDYTDEQGNSAYITNDVICDASLETPSY